MRRYQLTVAVADFGAAAFAGQLASLILGVAGTDPYGPRVDTLAMPFLWLAVVALNGGFESRYLGAGDAEFSRLFKSALHLVVLVAVASYAFRADVSRRLVFVAVPLAFAFDVLVRHLARKRLHSCRARGEAIQGVLAVGDSAAVVAFTTALTRDCSAGMLVRGACLTHAVPEDAARLASEDVLLVGDVDNILVSARAVGAHTVAVVSNNLGSEQLRWIAWQLEQTDIDLVVSPGLAEITGRRLHICPVAGLPLLHVDQPQFRGYRRLLKEAMDRAAALCAILVLSPVFVATYLAVRLSSPGPAIFRQTRVGRDGDTFTMLKFRTMHADAEARLADLQQHNMHSDGPLFKISRDPRVTPIGRVLRRYSLDELPQFFNVLAGQMSLVGPRPPLPCEVLKYEDAARRRLLVKPGLTGLWQISGRSDLSWEDSVRLDLRYVENWSPGLDLLILCKTAYAVIRGSGAY